MIIDSIDRRVNPCLSPFGPEKLRVRKSGLEFFIEIHIQVIGEMTVGEGHRIGHRVKDELLALMPRVRDVYVHVEPYLEQDDFEC